MSTRETIIKLDSGLALHTGIQTAIADKYRITKIRMATTVHGAVCQNSRFGRLDNDEGMKPLLLNYDFKPNRGLVHGDVCGWMFGQDVTLDETLKSRMLIVESEPIPA